MTSSSGSWPRRPDSTRSGRPNITSMITDVPRQLRHPQLPRRKTSRVKLGIGAAILPWNSPLRVVEKAIMLDQISGGRTFSDWGRGRPRWNTRPSVSDGRGPRPLQRGRTDGDVWWQSASSRATARCIRRSARSAVRTQCGCELGGRLFGAAMSPDTVLIIAQMGLQMMTFMQFPSRSMPRSSTPGSSTSGMRTILSPDRRSSRTS